MSVASLQSIERIPAEWVERLPQDLARFPLLQHLAETMPLADLVFGGAVLSLVILIHAIGLRMVTTHVTHRSLAALQRPTTWRADAIMSGAVLLLLFLHVFEIFVWTWCLVHSGVVSDWRAAAYFAGNTYTTVGYGSVILPPGWRMLVPIIAISGLFTFGWSGSVLVDLIGRCQKVREAALLRKGSTG